MSEETKPVEITKPTEAPKSAAERGSRPIGEQPAGAFPPSMQPNATAPNPNAEVGGQAPPHDETGVRDQNATASADATAEAAVRGDGPTPLSDDEVRRLANPRAPEQRVPGMTAAAVAGADFSNSASGVRIPEDLSLEDQLDYYARREQDPPADLVKRVQDASPEERDRIAKRLARTEQTRP